MAVRLPLFPLGVVLFPGAALPLHVFEPRYRSLIHDLMTEPPPRTFGVVAIREGHEVGDEGVRSLYDVGCTAVIREVQRVPDGRFTLLVVGDRRFRIVGTDRSRAYLQADVALLDEQIGDPVAVDRLAHEARSAYTAYHDLHAGARPAPELPTEASELSYLIATQLLVPLPERQALLETPDAARRLATEAEILQREVALTRNLRAVPLPDRPLDPGSLN